MDFDDVVGVTAMPVNHYLTSEFGIIAIEFKKTKKLKYAGNDHGAVGVLQLIKSATRIPVVSTAALNQLIYYCSIYWFINIVSAYNYDITWMLPLFAIIQNNSISATKRSSSNYKSAESSHKRYDRRSRRSSKPPRKRSVNGEAPPPPPPHTPPQSSHDAAASVLKPGTIVKILSGSYKNVYGTLLAAQEGTGTKVRVLLATRNDRNDLIVVHIERNSVMPVTMEEYTQMSCNDSEYFSEAERYGRYERQSFIDSRSHSYQAQQISTLSPRVPRAIFYHVPGTGLGWGRQVHNLETDQETIQNDLNEDPPEE